MTVLTSLLKCILDTNMVSDPNFSNWLHNLRIVHTYERITYVLKEKMHISVVNDIYDEKKQCLRNGRRMKL